MKNPTGICMCGCGYPAPPSPTSRRGYKRGEPLMYIKGHWSRYLHSTDFCVEDRGYDTPCWMWAKSVGSFGYGRIWNGVGHDMAHRVYYERHVGALAKGQEVHHWCSNPACVNPEHLRAVTRREHMALEGRRPFGNPHADPVAS